MKAEYFGYLSARRPQRAPSREEPLTEEQENLGPVEERPTKDAAAGDASEPGEEMETEEATEPEALLTEAEQETEMTVARQQPEAEGAPSPFPVWTVLLPAALAIILAALALMRRRGRKKEEAQVTPAAPGMVSSTLGLPVRICKGTLHQIGTRPSQQDSLGTVGGEDCLFAVVADGMGGLSDGDRVSQNIVSVMCEDVNRLGLGQLSGRLDQLVYHANQSVNQLLGERDSYVSGSTVVAALAEPDAFQWISVGDSKVYLCRGGALIQLNREHIYQNDLSLQAVNGQLPFREVRGNAQRIRVNSFLGMGVLRHVDQPLKPIRALPGDWYILASDGVFNTLSETEVAKLLQQTSDPEQAARALEQAVLSRHNPHQDNFTAILIAYQ